MRVSSRVPTGSHDVVVQAPVNSYQNLGPATLALAVENPYFGKVDPDPLLAEVQAKHPGAKVVELRRGLGPAQVADTNLYSVNNDHGSTIADAGQDSPLRLGHWFGGDYRVLARFDTAAIPPGATIRAAVLKFAFAREDYGTVKGNGVLRAYAVKRPWGEGGNKGYACWSAAQNNGKQPGSQPWEKPGCDGASDRSQRPVAEMPLAKGGQMPGFQALDVTEQARLWVAGREPNHGLLLRVEGTGELFPGALYSSEDPDEPFRPKLFVAYE